MLTPHQLFRVDDIHYGFQFHLEIDDALLRAMIADDTEGYLPSHGIDPDELLRTASRCLPAVEPTARMVFARWTGLLE
jgi:GMP synthase-like glutamine amidotransferase